MFQQLSKKATSIGREITVSILVACSMVCFFALILTLPSRLSAQSLVLLDSNKKEHIERAGSISILYKNTGILPLHIWAITLVQSGNHFTFDNASHYDSVLAPGQQGFFTIYFQTAVAYEYRCDLLLATNDPLHPIQTQHIRVNDTIPPNPVQNLREYPKKSGVVKFSWSPPIPPSDGDSVWRYEVYSGRPGDATDTLLATTLDTTVTVVPPGNGILYFSVVTWDDGGNAKVVTDTGWSSRYPPLVSIANVDPISNDIPEHVALGVQSLRVLGVYNRLSEIRVSEKDTAEGAPLVQIGDSIGKFYETDNYYSCNWNTTNAYGIKDIIVYARDSVGNDTSVTYRFQITQEAGWPRFIPHQITQPSSTTISADGTGTFLSTGSDIADGAFRPDGNIFYNAWPLNVTRPSEDFIVTSTADILPANPGYEMVMGNTRDQALLVGSDGQTITTLGYLPSASEVLSIHSTTQGRFSLLAGPSPVVIEDQRGTHIAGANSEWTPSGDSLQYTPVFPLEGQFEFDRVVAGSLNRDGTQQFIRVHSASSGLGEVIGVYDANGAIQAGWPRTLWYPTRSYHGFYPSIGDLGGNGQLEIVIPTPNDSVWAFYSDGTVLPGYPISMNTHDAGHNQALLVDVNDDGAADIILPAQDSIQCINGLSHQPMGGIWPIRRHTHGTTLLTVADLHGDGSLDLIESPQVSDTGAWCYVYKIASTHSPKAIQWGTFQHDMRRSGNYDEGSISLAVQKSTTVDASKSFCTLYPQPATTHATIQLDAYSAAHWKSLRVTDITGRTRIQIQNIEQRSIPQLDLSQLPSGSYFVTIETPRSDFYRHLAIVK